MLTHAESAKSLFLNALEIRELQARREFLDAQCGDNHELRCEVEALVKHHVQLGEFLDSPAADALGPTILKSALLEEPGAQIGLYKLLEKIGEGGFGVVFMAEQTAPVRRKVALKVIKPGMDTRQVIARFEA